MNTKFVQSKYEPDLNRNGHIARRRLIGQLEQGKLSKLTLVSAPAGFGKTTLLSDWYRSIGEPAVWLSLDEKDDDSCRFWTLFLTALTNAQSNLGLSALEMIRSTSAPELDAILNVLINELSQFGADIFVFIDDFHVIKDKAAIESFHKFLKHSPACMHLVLSTRMDPPLPLSRMRVRRQLAELRTADLRFSVEETGIFIREVMGITCSQLEIQAMESRTEGWIAGIQLAALSATGNRKLSDVLQTFDGGQNLIYDYLLEEVFRDQRTEVQEFLLQTSILDNLSPPLCDSVTTRDDSQAILEELDSTNLFIVTLDDRRGSYRFHQLLRDFLISRLSTRPLDSIQELHLRASQWYQENGQMSDAIRHALAATHFNLAADLMEMYGTEVVFQGQRATVLNWVSLMPENIVQSRPLLCILHAWTMIADRSDVSLRVMEKRLDQAEYLLSRARKSQSTAHRRILSDEQILGYIQALRAYQAIQLNKPDEQVIELAKRAADLNKDGDPRLMCSIHNSLGLAYYNNRNLGSSFDSFDNAWSTGNQSRSYHSAIFAQYMKANIEILHGKFDEAMFIITETRRIVVRPLQAEGRSLPMSGGLGLLEGVVQFEKEELGKAKVNLQTGLKDIEPLKEWGVQVYGYTTLARLEYAESRDFERSMEIVLKLEEIMQHFPGMEFLPNALRLELMVAECHRQPGLISQTSLLAGLLLREIDVGAKQLSHFQCYSWHVVALINIVRFLAFQASVTGSPDHIEHLRSEQLKLIKLLPRVISEDIVFLQLRIHIALAIAFQATEDQDDALTHINCALSLAGQKGYLRTFISEGLPMVSLLRLVVDKGVCKEFAGRLLSTMTVRMQEDQQLPRQGNPPQVSESLSQREIEILRLVAAGLSNQQIANQLFLSLGTIKKHISNIFVKLNVRRRTEAVALSRRLKII
ncbi:MAG: LuxR C-terminal-related transcriptional regulator [Halioglobus sp.]